MSELERLAKVLFASEQCHKDCAPEVIDGAWASTDCDFKSPRIESVRAILMAMREPSETRFHDKSSDDLIDWSAKCGYCGGHKFAWQATIDHILEERAEPSE